MVNDMEEFVNKMLAEHSYEDVMSMFVSTTVGLFHMGTLHLDVMKQDEGMEILLDGMRELLALYQSMGQPCDM